MKIPTWYQTRVFALYAAVGAILATTLLAVIIAATNSTRVAQSVGERDRALEAIQGCTTPGRRCYERSQRQTAKAVGDINLVIVYAAACASGPIQRPAEWIQVCVQQRLAQKPK